MRFSLVKGPIPQTICAWWNQRASLLEAMPSLGHQHESGDSFLQAELHGHDPQQPREPSPCSGGVHIDGQSGGHGVIPWRPDLQSKEAYGTWPQFKA